MKRILSFGGGVDSTAILVTHLFTEDLDIDHVVFSDTGAEADATYEHLDFVEALCADANLPFDRVSRAGETITEFTLRLGNVPVMGGGSHVCSKKFKGEVLAKWAKATYPDETITWLIGIEANETRRAVFTPPAGDTAIYEHPLIDRNLTRADCLELLKTYGLGHVVKSSCVFCPFLSIEEIEGLYRNDPEKWELCREIEHKFEETSPIRYQDWIDAGKPLTKGEKQRAPTGMWSHDSWAEGRRLFIKKIGGKQLTIEEWEQHFDELIPVQEVA